MAVRFTACQCNWCSTWTRRLLYIGEITSLPELAIIVVSLQLQWCLVDLDETVLVDKRNACKVLQDEYDRLYRTTHVYKQMLVVGRHLPSDNHHITSLLAKVRHLFDDEGRCIDNWLQGEGIIEQIGSQLVITTRAHAKRLDQSAEEYEVAASHHNELKIVMQRHEFIDK